MTYVPKYADLTRCPKCRSHRIFCGVGVMYDMCTKCRTIWERIPAGEHFTSDGEMMAFHVPCDNCAFRGKSPERMDPERWNELQLSLAFGGGMFYCHKGVPVDPKDAEDGGGLAFQWPKKRKTVDIAGECHPYKDYDLERMRLCRGYLNQHVAPKMTCSPSRSKILSTGSALSDDVEHGPL